ncbi:MAG: Hydroxyacylglutathione hydrolase [Deltaproteobacteria bacterium]|jgi:glyoxylase-like metal-dependent hydrolase (beta-lactamase superfamily II)/8-oxo-dGTP pyrophosphatase MutT (NUDIX family)|nr:Hydroxyacylglutathione hydrolase [Deltaproteobacteria bacterium]
MDSPAPLESVSVLFIHQQKIFTVQRQTYLLAFPGYHAFPGGKIDKDESSLPFKTRMLCDHDSTRMRAIQREILEELDYDLEQGILNGEVLSVSELAEAVAPTFAPFRFRTWFYRIDLKERVRFNADPGEFADSFWSTPQNLLDAFSKGKNLMVPPTRWVLKGLVADPQAAALGNVSEMYDEEHKVPCLEMMDGITMLPVRSVTLPPANRTNAFLLGDSGAEKLLIDPSPNSEEEYRRLLTTIENNVPDSIFLTHHHPDHHQFSNQLARELRIPIILSQDTLQRLTVKYGEAYFENIELQTVSENKQVTSWHGSAVRVYEIPGHDQGHLGLAPDTMDWFLVGDLIQGIGTVVIPSPEGDMATYFSTLKKVIALNPEVIIPSHGIPMRTTHRLEETLKHRLQRESQILKLHQSGKSRQEILMELYAETDARLHPAAMQNIESHLAKLHKENYLQDEIA